MGEPTVNDWLNDTWEAYQIGQQLGERVIVIGVSTGGTAATWLATQPETSSLMATVLISPTMHPTTAPLRFSPGPGASKLPMP